MSLYAFRLGQIISTILGQVDHGGQDGNGARTHLFWGAYMVQRWYY